MDDISSLLMSLLDKPEVLDMLKDFTGNPHQSDEGQEEKKDKPSGGFSFGDINPDMLNMIAKFAPIMGQINEPDDNEKLLHAIRPYLEDDKKKRLDSAAKVLQLIKIMNTFKKQNIL